MRERSTSRSQTPCTTTCRGSRVKSISGIAHDQRSYGPFSTFDAYLTWFEGLRRDATVLLFVILDQSLVFDHPLATPELESHRTERIAGSIALLKTDHVNRETEIGHVKIHSRFQRTHVLTHAAGLILKWLFDEVGYRRVSWFANHLNRPSVEAALRLGYFEEGTLRWNRVLAAGKLGQPLPPAMAEREAAAGRGTVGRHSVVLAIGFDDWNDGRDGAEPISVRMSRLMDREVVKKAAV